MRLFLLLAILVIPAAAQDWRWVHFGVGTQITGNAFDIISSWEQPEKNSFLANRDHKFAWKGLAIKVSLSAIITSISYWLSYNFPNMRRFVSTFNFVIGGSWMGTAIYNW